ncbi:MAG TPA: PQQ-binding-like beta-propeller repeat protein [Bacteroidales bacterium]|nr:PQQ-binding-like beta-propeller repeat protein [Bacteroidales bacterium]
MKFKNIIYIALVLFVSCKNEINDKFRKDDSNSGYYLSNSVLNNPQELWKYKTGGIVNASPVCDDKSIYIGSADSIFYSLNIETGDINWKYQTEGKIFSTAYLSSDFVYFLSYDGYLYKLNKRTGALIWKFKTEGEEPHMIKDYYDITRFATDFWDFYQSSPVEKDDMIYFGCGKYFYAVKSSTGKEIWSVSTEGVNHSSPAIQNDKLIFGSFDSNIYCLNRYTGEKIWSYETGRDTARYTWIGVQASPAVDGENVYIGSRDGLIYKFNINTGDTIWTNNNFERSWMPSSFAIDDKIYCGSSDAFSFYEIDKESGKINFRISTNSYTFSSPAIDSNMAYIGSANGRLYGINLKKKQIAWEFRTHGSLTDTLRIYNKQGILDLDKLKLRAKESKVADLESLIHFYQGMFISQGAILSSPVIKNGIIYFASNDGYVYAVK